MAYVMIVDDDEDFARAVAMALRADGHEVRAETEPEGALEAMRARPPDLAIIDVMFPEDVAAGFELAHRIKKEEPDLKGVPIILLTAVNARLPLGFTREDIQDGWLDIVDFLEKPIELDVLTRKVNELLEAAG